MKTKVKTLAMVLITAQIIACNSPKQETEVKEEVKTYEQIKKASWLLGNWQNINGESKLSESWIETNDSSYSGRGLFIMGKDTLSNEQITLEQNANDLYYIPTIKEQNGGKPVKFKLTASTESSLVFENPEHDFPQKISYTKITSDSIEAEISGNLRGQIKTEKFSMGRAK